MRTRTSLASITVPTPTVSAWWSYSKGKGLKNHPVPALAPGQHFLQRIEHWQWLCLEPMSSPGIGWIGHLWQRLFQKGLVTILVVRGSDNTNPSSWDQGRSRLVEGNVSIRSNATNEQLNPTSLGGNHNNIYYALLWVYYGISSRSRSTILVVEGNTNATFVEMPAV